MQPPQNPYTPSSYDAPAPRRPEISFDVITQAWAALQPNLGTYLGAAAVILVVSAVFQGLQGAMTPRSGNGQQEFSMIPLILGLVGSLINQFLGGGILRMAINHLRTGRPEFGDMFSVGDVFINLILAGIVVGIATVLGFCACIIPGLLLTGLFMFVNPLIVDKRLGAMDAISTSFNTLKPQMWMALVFVFVVGLVAVSGLIACGVGLLVTIPLAVLSIAITYRNFFDNGQAMPMVPNYPVAPIADPRS